MFVVGIDPGLASFGFAVLDVRSLRRARVLRLGVVTTTKGTDRKLTAAKDNARRCTELAKMLEVIVARPVWLVCAEAMSFPRSSSAAAKMAMSWGLIVANVVKCGAHLLQASPQAVKLVVVGRKDASKKQVEDALQRRYGKRTKALLKGVRGGLHEHAFDALAAADACMRSPEGQEILKKEFR